MDRDAGVETMQRQEEEPNTAHRQSSCRYMRNQQNSPSVTHTVPASLCLSDVYSLTVAALIDFSGHIAAHIVVVTTGTPLLVPASSATPRVCSNGVVLTLTRTWQLWGRAVLVPMELITLMLFFGG